MAVLESVPQFTSIVTDRGADFEVSWPLTGEDGQPFDPTGATVRAALRFDVLADAAPLHVWTTETGGGATIENGRLYLRNTPAETAAWSFDGGTFDIRATNDAGQAAFPITGTLRVRAKNTRSS